MVPVGTNKVAVDVVSEEEVVGGWQHTARIVRAGGAESTHTVRLAWVDHDYWCDGAKPPSVVTRVLLEYLAQWEPILELPARFDASTARRWVPGIDDELARLI
ncbi:MAG: hypothetical protein KF902_04710 [Phycisphaeraceae bacterium]|nr:hypothetical protein [Phycisphaeraceae bacterium]MBX3361057.1 hypothetical protein [Phycisphaeraceae bacterium]MBX3366269.1 hypothetical protein [Phycisphaeraceae bacterium]MCW5769254.1 hypothetical protein [Phycisphaeraceae bacterium]QYK48725.1 MAG: hypothetical protein KF838_02470 [Phycisphaeraceae bacterium]